MLKYLLMALQFIIYKNAHIKLAQVKNVFT